MAEIIHLPQIHRIAYTDGEDESFVSDGYGGEWKTRSRGEAEEYLTELAYQWPTLLFWIVEGN